MNVATIIKALDKAAKAPKVTKNTEDPAELYLKSLKKVVAVVREAEAQKKNANLSDDDWNGLLAHADKLASELCFVQYEEDYTDQVAPFALPSDESNHLKTKLGVPFRGLDMFAKIFGISLADMKSAANKAPDLNLFERAWSATLRPTPHSTVLSRFPDSYDNAAIAQAIARTIQDHPSVNSEKLTAVLQASAEVHYTQIPIPLSLAIHGDIMVASGAGGFKERDPCLTRFVIPSGTAAGKSDGGAMDEDNAEAKEEEAVEEEPMESGFTEPFTELHIDDSGIWGAGDDRIKAWTLDEGALMHTLNSTGYDGMFGVTNDIVFRANSKGEFAKWERSALKEHKSYWYWDCEGKKVKPLGGRLEPDYVEDGTEVEISMGQKPKSTFKIPGITGYLAQLVSIPNTTNWLCTHRETQGSGPRPPYGVKMFDITQPEAGARVVGMGLSSRVGQLAVHKDLPNQYVAAGIGEVARIYDIRHPFPQVMLEGHSRHITCCAIASFGGHYPITFTGGEDELVKSWDIRNTKSVLYELSTGTLFPEGLAWHDGRNSLFIVGRNENRDRLGYHHDYSKIPKPRAPRSTGGDDMDDEEDEEDEDDYEFDDSEDEYWPDDAFTRHDHFGKPWCSVEHALLEYHFKPGADISVIPESEGPSFYEDAW